MSDQDDKSALDSAEQGADEMGGATGITGGDESGRPGEGVESTSHGDERDEQGVPGGPAGTGAAAGGGRAEGGAPQAPDDVD